MASLGHAGTGGGAVGQVVALDHRDVVELLGERPGSGEAAHAGAEDDGVAVSGRDVGAGHGRHDALHARPHIGRMT